MLELSTYVYVDGKPIKGKLEPKRNGPYIVSRVNKSGNYKVTTLNGKKFGTYPRNKLTVVDDIELNEVEFGVEKVLDCRAKDGSIEYLVKWSNKPETEKSWVKESHIDNVEAIQDFNFDNNTSVEVNFGRFNMTLFLNILYIFLIFFTGVSGNSININDRFHYCKYDLTYSFIRFKF